MSKKMPAQSPSDAAAMAMLTKGDGDMGPREMAKDKDQKEVDGGQQGGETKEADALKKNENEKGKENEDEDEDEEGKGVDEQEKKQEKEQGGKGFTEDDLCKALNRAAAIASGASLDAVDRRQVLADKLSKGELTPEETTELMGHLNDPVQDPKIQKGYADRAAGDPDISDVRANNDGAVDVSGFLQRFASMIGGGLDDVAGSLEKGFLRLNSYNHELAKAQMAFAKSVQQISKMTNEQRDLIKGLGERLEKIESAPVGRRSAASAAEAKQLRRGFGPSGEDDGLSRNDMIKGLIKMQRESKDGKTPGGHDITWATASIESGQGVPNDLVDEVKKALNK